MENLEKVVRDMKRNDSIKKEQFKVNFNRVVESVIQRK